MAMSSCGASNPSAFMLAKFLITSVYHFNTRLATENQSDRKKLKKATKMAGRHLLLLATTLLLPFAAAADGFETKSTNLQFYMHDVVDGPNATVARVAPSQPLNFSASDPIAASFGSLYVIDDPLTVSPERSSELVGRAQGMYAMASLGNEFSLSMMLTYSFVSGPYNGSSFSVLGRNPVLREVREMPIVGGTGIFRLGRGFCLAQTHSSVGFDAVIRYNVTVLHY
ncbi:dirigent protein 1-like [Aristolochia californica]|uniref:dirigent protein 1-like n=1 Tax=Aristolochia californica TaxID=171875 RepID=UPI0035E062E5